LYQEWSSLSIQAYCEARGRIVPFLVNAVKVFNVCNLKRFKQVLDAHRRVRVNIEPPTSQANFKRLVNKIAIKPKKGGPPLAIFLKTLDHPFWQTFDLPFPPGFSTSVHL
jgi:hypothetical protein